ncbi:MAG: type IV secretory pathway protein AcvB [Rhodovulum sulfidophilum]|uniref:Type IV secretory pathway protein AcvB n=1 Tax=Rhodovulum sulfidophilum TaxID=35806 RepID=A0A2W5NG67_RHOSU|nr:MAG: type IV secretory pathway protein AcvB [Rhodovulum sulfidophilum]
MTAPRLPLALGLALLLVAPGTGFADTAPPASPPNAIAAPRIMKPATGAPPSAEVALISDADGWGAAEQTAAEALTAKGALVVGIDLPDWLAASEASPRGCLYLTGDIEALSHQVQRGSGGPDYLPPLVAGVGAGGAVALAVAAQTPLATMGGTIAVNPTATIPLRKPLCTKAVATPSADGAAVSYGLTPGALPDPVTIGLTPAADPDGAAHAKALQAEHPEITITQAADPAGEALVALVSQAIASDDKVEAADPLGLPLSILDAQPTRDTMAVIYSGDGGWRDLDRQVGGVLQGLGVPVVGLDSLRYFWDARQPQETADDLVRIIEHYTAHWGVHHVLLIGYSFGADILPATYNLLPPETRAKVPQLSLLALGREKPYQISVLGWFGKQGGGGDPSDDIRAIDPAVVQCVYGTEETDDPCPDFAKSGVEAIAIQGGHHFDGDYQGLAKRILDGLDRRLAQPEASSARSIRPRSSSGTSWPSASRSSSVP